MKHDYIRKRKNNIIAHADDEVLGCGGLIEKACRYYNQVKVIVIAVGDIIHTHNENLY